MKAPLSLTAEQMAYAEKNYKPGIPGCGAAKVARALGVSRDGFLRNFNSEYRQRRNRQAAASMQRKRKPDLPTERAKITLAKLSWQEGT